MGSSWQYHTCNNNVYREISSYTHFEDNTTFQSILDYCDGHRLWWLVLSSLRFETFKSSDGIPFLEYRRGVTHSRPVKGTCTPVCPQDPPSSSSYACVPARTRDLRIVSVFPQNYNSQKYVDQLETPSSNDRDRRPCTIHVPIRRYIFRHTTYSVYCSWDERSSSSLGWGARDQ